MQFALWWNGHVTKYFYFFLVGNRFLSLKINSTFWWKLNTEKSPQGPDLYTHCSTLAIGASCQVSLKSVHQIWRRRFLKGFYHIWAWQPSWSCELDNLYIQYIPYSIDASHKIWLWIAKRFQRRSWLNIMVIYMYIAPGWGQMSPWGPIFFRIINIQSYCPFPARPSL